MKKIFYTLSMTVMIMLLLGGFSSVSATSFTIADGNSSAHVDTDFGMDTWEIDGIDHLYQQWFWYRIGDTGPEQQIQTLGPETGGTSDTDFDGIDDNLYLSYSDGSLEIAVNYKITGGTDGSGTADIAETINITNIGSSALDFHFFQYSDFDLIGTIGDDYARLDSPSLISQWDEFGPALSETSAIQAPNRWQISPYAVIVNSLDDDAATTLTNGTSPLGPGDITWAFEWDVSIAAGGSLLISKDKLIREPVIPEPTTIMLLGIGVVALGVAVRKRSHR